MKILHVSAVVALVLTLSLMMIKSIWAGPGPASKGQRQTGCTTNHDKGQDAACKEKTETASACATAPELKISVSPAFIWPPNKKQVAVNLSGTVFQSAGCALQSASFQMIDEYGANQSGSISVDAAGNFHVVVYVEAWRNGNDKDGRIYSFTASATNAAGTGISNTAVSTVAHDQRP